MTTLTWKSQPATGEWNTADNWTPSGLPAEKAEHHVADGNYVFSKFSQFCKERRRGGVHRVRK